jgi:superfamily II DNA helicase RecQ
LTSGRQDGSELAEVYGIGAVKLEKYGETFLEIIRQYRP